jgi:hypothetical protein
MTDPRAAGSGTVRAADAPDLVVLRGSPTDEELAALVLVLAAVRGAGVGRDAGGAQPSGQPACSVRAAWRAPRFVAPAGWHETPAAPAVEAAWW